MPATRMFGLRAAASLALLTLSLPAPAALWKCTDAAGTTSYQQAPCPGGAAEPLADEGAYQDSRGIEPTRPGGRHTGAAADDPPHNGTKRRWKDSDAARREQQKKCKSYGEQLARNTEKQRRGNKAKAAEKLREERERIKEYLFENCPEF